MGRIAYRARASGSSPIQWKTDDEGDERMGMTYAALSIIQSASTCVCVLKLAVAVTVRASLDCCASKQFTRLGIM